MYTSSELRSIARKALKGFWGLSVGVTLVFSILGGQGVSFSYDSNGNGPMFANEYGPILTAILVFFTILAIVKFIIGGPIQQGLCRYNINLLTREDKPSFNDLFSQFSNFGNAFGLNFMIGLFTAL